MIGLTLLSTRIQLESQCLNYTCVAGTTKIATEKTSILQNNSTIANRGLQNSTRFILVIGLEGTGHHLIGRIIKNSPRFHYLKEVGIYPDLLANLHVSLSNTDKTGMWNLQCSNAIDTIEIGEVTKRVVDALQDIHQAAASNNKNTHHEVLVPINSVEVGDDKHWFGEMSYPNFGGGCRFLNTPNIHTWYEACAQANVDCQHIYLHRDASEILESTTIRRHFNPHIFHATHLYKAMLDGISADLATFSAHTWACVGFYEERYQWEDAMRRLGGWRNETKFQAALRRIYPANRHRTNGTDDPLEFVEKYGAYYESLRISNEKAIRQCRDSLLTGTNSAQSNVR